MEIADRYVADWSMKWLADTRNRICLHSCRTTDDWNVSKSHIEVVLYIDELDTSAPSRRDGISRSDEWRKRTSLWSSFVTLHCKLLVICTTFIRKYRSRTTSLVTAIMWPVSFNYSPYLVCAERHKLPSRWWLRNRFVYLASMTTFLIVISDVRHKHYSLLLQYYLQIRRIRTQGSAIGVIRLWTCEFRLCVSCFME